MKYVWKDDSWWDQPPCDCCDDYYVESYSCTSHPSEIYSSESSYNDILAVCIYQHLGYDLYDYDFLELTSYYGMNTIELEREAVKLGIEIVIED